MVPISMDDLHDDMGRGNLGKIWWLITLTLASLFWFVGSYLLYRSWYEDTTTTPRTLFNPFTNLANLAASVLIAWVIMLPFKPKGGV